MIIIEIKDILIINNKDLISFKPADSIIKELYNLTFNDQIT